MANICRSIADFENGYGSLATEFYALVKNGYSEEAFVEFLKRIGTLRAEAVRYYATGADDVAEVKGFMDGVMGEIRDDVSTLRNDPDLKRDLKARGVKVKWEKMLGDIGEALSLNDLTQKAELKEPERDRGYEEILKENEDRLDEEYRSVFGFAPDLVDRVRNDLNDRVARVTTWDNWAGVSYEGDEEVELSIWRERARAYAALRGYLADRFPDDADVSALPESLLTDAGEVPEGGVGVGQIRASELATADLQSARVDMRGYYDALNLFRRLVLKNASFRDAYTSESLPGRVRSLRVSHERDYRNMVRWLAGNAPKVWAKALAQVGAGTSESDIERGQSRAYEGTMPSQWAMALRWLIDHSAGGENRRAVERMGRELSTGGAAFDPVERARGIMDVGDSPLVSAVKDYFFLAYTDDLIESAVERTVTIDPELRGVPDLHLGKYRMSSRGSGIDRHWGNEDQNGTDLFTSNTVDSIMGQMELLSYGNVGAGTSRRLVATEVVRVFEKLKDGISSGRISFKLKPYSKGGKGAAKGSTTEVTTPAGVLRNQIKDRVLAFDEAPLENMMWLFEQLFGRSEERFGGGKLIDSITYNNKTQNQDRLSAMDRNILYSFYRQVADMGGGRSLAGYLSRRGLFGRADSRAWFAINSLARYFASNDMSNWATFHSGRSGESSVRIETGNIQNYDVKVFRDGINAHVNGNRISRGDLQERYGFKPRVTADDTRYGVTLRDGTQVEIGSTSNYGLMYGDERSGEVTVSMEPDGADWMKDYWKTLDDAVRGGSLGTLLDAVKDYSDRDGRMDHVKNSLGKGLAALYGTLEFIDDYLNLGMEERPDEFFSVLSEYADRYRQEPGMAGLRNFMMPLVKMAMRAAYASSRITAAEEAGEPVGVYLNRKNDPLYRAYWRDSKRRGGGLRHIGLDFSSGTCEYVVASSNDDAVRQWAEASAAWSGRMNGSTLTRRGKTSPMSFARMLANDVYATNRRIKKANNGTGPARYSGIVDSTWRVDHPYDMSSDGVVKSFREGNVRELLYESVIGFKARSLENDGVFRSMGSSFGGKKTAALYEVRKDWLRDNGVVDVEKGVRDDYVRAMMETTGKYYEEIYDKSKEKLGAVLGRAAEILDGEPGQAGRAKAIRDNLVRGEGNVYTDDLFKALALVSEEELADAAQTTVVRNSKGRDVTGVRVTRDLDYRVGGDGRLVGNELLRMSSSMFGDVERLRDELRRCSVEYVRDLLDWGVDFKVLNKYDKYTYHVGKEERKDATTESRNNVYRSIRYFLDNVAYYQTPDVERGSTLYRERRSADYFRKWVRRDGQLIYAKQGKRDVMTRLDLDPYSSEPFELNPFLEWSFMIDNLVDTAYKLVSVGSDISSPVKGSAVFDELRGLDANGIREGAERIGVTLDGADAARISGELRRMNGVNDLVIRADSLRTNPAGASDGVRAFYEAAYDMEWRHSLSRALDANSKRYGGTLSPSSRTQSNMLNGTADKLTVACYDDVTSEAWTLRGEYGTVKAHEGAIFGTQFQQRLENNSYLDHRTGNLMKTMLYALYDEYGVADYLKHNANMFTNAYFRLTEHEQSSITGLGLLKKMTNRQFGREDGINLVKNGLDPGSMSDAEHVLNRMFGGKWTYYTEAGGGNRFIETLGASEVEGLGRMYYTVEGDGSVPEEAMDAEERKAVRRGKVYHIFYDRVEGGRVVETSLHMRVGRSELVETMERLRAQGANPHTVNSIYELWSALGGMYCTDGTGAWSERNNDIVANFISYTVRARRDRADAVGDSRKFNQRNFKRLLDKYHTAYLIPVSSMKKGVSNINSTGRLDATDVRPLNTFELNSNFGIQLDAGKPLDNPEIATPTQLLSSIGTGGVSPQKVRELNEVMAAISLEKAPGFVEMVNSAVANVDYAEREEKRQRLVSTLNKIFYDNLDNNNRNEIARDVAASIKDFSSSGGEGDDRTVRLPFSSPAIYRQFISSVSSFLTNRVIKIRQKGSGMIIMPSSRIVRLYDVEVGGKVIPMTPEDVFRRAKAAYRDELLSALRRDGFAVVNGADGNPVREYSAETDSITLTPEPAEDGGKQAAPEVVALEPLTISELERLALRYDPEGKFSAYRTEETDPVRWQRHLMDTYLRGHMRSGATTVYRNREHFAPGDVVDVVELDRSGRPARVVETVELKYSNYRRFKDGIGGDGRPYDRKYGYVENITSSRNLKPRLIRWGYIKNGVRHEANYFDLDNVWSVLPDHDGRRTVDPKDDLVYAKSCEDAMARLYAGKFRLHGEDEDREVDGKIEQRMPEIVHGNLDREQFGIADGETLADVLEQGRDYFSRRMEDRLRAPAAELYDIAMLRTAGNHTYLMFGDVPEDLKSQETKWRGEWTDGDNIWIKKGQRNEFIVARWVDVGEGSDIVLKKGNLESLSGAEVDRGRYRKGVGKDGKPVVQERVDLVKRHTVLRRETDSKGREVTRETPIYVVQGFDAFRRAYYNADYADGMLARTVGQIFRSGGYDTLEIAQNRDRMDAHAVEIGAALDRVADVEVGFGPVREMIRYQAGILRRDGESTWEGYSGLRSAWLEGMTDEVWSSFQDSTELMSTRIPASGMMSYMGMESAAWTGQNDNSAYVSDSQIYFQGSDFDTDKANVTGSNYDSMGRYIGWSPLFDLSTKETLDASKTLPVPKLAGRDAAKARAYIEGTAYNVEARETDEDGSERVRTVKADEIRLPDITGALSRIAELTVIDTEEPLEEKRGLRLMGDIGSRGRAAFLRAMSDALYGLHDGNWKFKYDGADPRLNGEWLRAFVNTALTHERHIIPQAYYEKAHLNAMQAIVSDLARDLRNAISTDSVTTTRAYDEAAETTPKGRATERFNPFVPSQKWIQLVDDRSANQAVGIAANVGKVFDVLYQYYMGTFSGFDDQARRFMWFDVTLDGIEGRADGEAVPKRINHLPDLNMRDGRVVDSLERMYRSYNRALGESERGRAVSVPDFRSEIPVRVKEYIAQLINVATDDGKLHDLQRINGIPQLMSNFGTMAILGFGVRDAVAFMTTPYMNELVRNIYGNMYGYDYADTKINYAIDAAVGRVPASRFLKGMKFAGITERGKTFEPKVRYYARLIAQRIGRKEFGDIGTRVHERLERELGIGKDDRLTRLVDEKKLYIDDLVQAFVIEAAKGVVTKNGVAVERPLRLAEVLGEEVNEEDIDAYVIQIDERVASMRADALEYGLMADGTLSERLDAGVEQMLKDRESFKALKEVTDELTTLSVTYLSSNQGDRTTGAKRISLIRNMNRAVTDREKALGIDGSFLVGKNGKYDGSGMDELVGKIRAVRPDLSANEIRGRLEAAGKQGMVGGGFDITRAVADEGYMENAVRYLDMIKRMENTLDVVRKNPAFWSYVRLIVSKEVSQRLVSAKHRLLNELAAREEYVSDDVVRKLDAVADRILMANYFRNHEELVFTGQKRGFKDWSDGWTDRFVLKSDQGMAGFSRYVVEELLDALKDKYPDNGFLKNVNVRRRNGRDVIVPIKDMLATDRRESGDVVGEMVSGMRGLEAVWLDDLPGYRASDAFYLYNLIENAGRAGRDTLTKAMRGLDVKSNEPGRHARWINRIDRDSDWKAAYDPYDVKIMMADVVDEADEKYANGRAGTVIKSVSESGVLTVKEYDQQYHSFNRVNLQTVVDRTSDPRVKAERTRNFRKYSPVEMPKYMSRVDTEGVILFGKDADVGVRTADIRRLIVNRSVEGLTHFVVEC